MSLASVSDQKEEGSFLPLKMKCKEEIVGKEGETHRRK